MWCRYFFYFGIACLLGVVTIIAYMAVWIPYVEGLEVSDYNKHCPRVVLAAVLQMALLWFSCVDWS